MVDDASIKDSAHETDSARQVLQDYTSERERERGRPRERDFRTGFVLENYKIKTERPERSIWLFNINY